MPENTKNIPVRLPLPLHKAATLKRVNDNEKSLQDVIVRLLSRWVEQPQARAADRATPAAVGAYPYKAANREWHDKLEAILEDPTERAGIEANLRWGAKAVADKPAPHARKRAG